MPAHPPDTSVPAPAEAPVATRARAKINLGLHVLRRRSDGYHDVETVMLPIGWADGLSVAPSPTFSLTCSDAALPTDDGNLVVRAAKALARWAGIAPRGRMHLEKRVPYGAGLGSGSSDAAATLRLLASVWELDVAPDDLHRLAAALGSDVPFFLHPGAAVATGRGELLQPLLDPAGASYRLPYTLVVVVPPIHVATAEAYGLVTPSDHARPDLAEVVRGNDLARWRRELVNDFEAPILTRYPSIHQAKRLLYAAGAGYAALSGSGAAVFGVFERADAAQEAAAAATAEGLRVWAAPTDGPG